VVANYLKIGMDRQAGAGKGLSDGSRAGA